MIYTTETLLPSTNGRICLEGKPVKAIAYYSTDTNKRLNTIAIHTFRFTGRLYLYGTLSVDVENAIWSPIPLGEDTNYLEYNYIESHPMVDYPFEESGSGLNKPFTKRIDNRYININGSYTWLKMKMDRSYLQPFKHLTTDILNEKTITYGDTISYDDLMSTSGYQTISQQTRLGIDLRNYGSVTQVLLSY